MTIIKEHRQEIPLKVPDNMKIRASQNGWMMNKMAEWFRHVWGCNVGVCSLSILDHAVIHTSHSCQERAKANDINLLHIPGGCTHLLQLANQSWCKPFKG